MKQYQMVPSCKGSILPIGVGANAYLEKPFTVRVFLAQVYALLRRIEVVRPGHAGQLQVGGLVINVTRNEVMVDGEPVHLTPTSIGS